MRKDQVLLAGCAALALIAGRCGPPEVDMPDPDSSLVSEASQVHTGALEAGDLKVADGSIIDTYAIDPPPATRVTATLRSTDFDPFLFIATPSGATISDEDSKDGPDPRVTMTADEAGPYIVQVTSRSPGETGGYTLTIERAP
jgi:hypothetical protein